MPPAAGGGAAEGARQVSRRRAGEVKALVQDVCHMPTPSLKCVCTPFVSGNVSVDALM